MNRSFPAALVTLLALLVLARNPSALGQAEPSVKLIEPADRIREVRERMDKEKKALADLLRKQGGILEKLEALKFQQYRSTRRLADLKKERTAAEAERAELERRMEELGRELAQKRKSMARRLRARYLFGRRGVMRLWLAAEDPVSLSRLRKYLDVVFKSDAARVAVYRESLGKWSLARDGLEKRRTEIAELSKVLLEQQAAMEEEQKSLQVLLVQVREEQAAHEAAIAELKAAEQKLAGVLAALEARREENETGPADGSTAAGEFAALKGALCKPASGAVLTGFGQKVHPKFGTVTMQNGVEIGASAGAPVRAVAAGTIRFAEWFRGYGNLVIVDHGDGYYTLYAHLDQFRVTVGEEVKKNRVIGTVGDTGSMSGPCLYFEIRHHQKPLDPAAWLGNCG